LAKAATRKLKVYQARFGFYDSVVAAPNQAAALRAWGTRQNLFGEGQATLTTDETVVAAALAHPETPLRRAIGSDAPFSLEPAAPNLPDPPKPARKAAPKTPPAPAPAKPPPDRARLDAAEAALDKIDARRKRQEADLRSRREALEAEDAEAREAWARQRAQAKERIEQERAAYLKAGGEG